MSKHLEVLQSKSLLPDDYYDDSTRFEINRGLRFTAKNLLFGGLRVSRGRTIVSLPESVAMGLGTNVVVAATHRSWEDIPRTVAATDRAGIKPVRFVFKAEFCKPSVVGRAFEKMGGVAVDRLSPDAAGLLKILGGFLDEEQSVAFYPEATRKKTDTRKIGDLKSGAITLAARHNVPVLPLAIAGVAQDDERPMLLDRQPVVAVFGEPITPSRGNLRSAQDELAVQLQVALDHGYEMRSSEL